MQPMKTRSRETILDQGRFLVVENHTVELPDGSLIPEWPWIITPDFVNILPVTSQGTFLCFRQTKYGLDGTSLAVVGGYLEPGESPLEAGQRELLEETGYQAAEWHFLGSFQVDGNRGVGNAHLFLALDARPVAQADADDLEEMELLELNREELERQVLGDGKLASQFRVLPWATTVSLALLHLDRFQNGNRNTSQRPFNGG